MDITALRYRFREMILNPYKIYQGQEKTATPSVYLMNAIPKRMKSAMDVNARRRVYGPNLWMFLNP
jgi:hypothetical protein